MTSTKPSIAIALSGSGVRSVARRFAIPLGGLVAWGLFKFVTALRVLL